MKWEAKSWRSIMMVSLVACLLIPVTLCAAERVKRMKPQKFNPADKTVDLFEAMKADQIEVKFIPKDSTMARVLVKNKTDKPLNVKMPDAFSAVPVVAQFGGGFAPPGGGIAGGPVAGGRRGNRGGSRFGGGGMSQGLGGGFGGNMMMGGMFNIPPEAVGDVKVAAVCLEHGKPDPSPQIPYTIQPVESFTDSKEVKALCQILGEGKVTQHVAQAAAWHLSNKMSWEELSAKQIRRANGACRPFFHPQELQLAYMVVEEAKKRVKAAEKEEDYKSSQPTESLSVR